MPLGRIEEAIAQVRLAKKADPLSPNAERALAYVLFAPGASMRQLLTAESHVPGL
jgi:hypothetical protein